MVKVVPGDPLHPQARALLEQSHAMMLSMFPAESNHAFAVDRLCADDVVFLVAQEGDIVVGTGAYTDMGDYAEIKALFTDPAERGKGIADAILTELTGRAQRAGFSSLRLETGTGLDSALRLYERHGFAFRGPFGDYGPDPHSIFMEKRVT